MPTMFVEPTTESHAQKSDFGARVSGEKLLVPQDVAAVLQKASVRTAEEFLSFVASFPAALARELGWNVEDVRLASDRLRATLQGLVRDEALRPRERFTRGFGALDPELKKR